MPRSTFLFVITLAVWAGIPLGAQPVAKSPPMDDAHRSRAATPVFQPLLNGDSCSVAICDVTRYCRSGSGPDLCLEQTCPGISWRVCAQDRGLRGLWLGNVDLKRGPNEPWMDVLWEAGVADLLTNYHNGTHLPDMKYCTAPSRCLRGLDADAVGPSGKVLTLSGDVESRLAVELRDRGVAWLCTWRDEDDGIDRSRVQRGEEMVLWGVYDTGNYDFIIQYAFGDDGAIRFRLGATGYNNADFPSDAHMHTALWRADLDIDGHSRDTAKLLLHREGFPSPLEAKDIELPFHGGREGSQSWVGRLFTTLLVEDSSTNAHGHHRGFELIPSLRGQARHRGPGERYTQSEFWVTVWDYAEAGYSPPNDWHRNGGVTPQTFLVEAAAKGAKGQPESVEDADLVAWYMAGEHHDPHDEDRSAGDVGLEPEGVTLVHWWGFDLVPHNLFDHNPLGSPHRSDCID